MSTPSMWMISYRDKFWEGNAIAAKTQMAMIDQNGVLNPKVPDWGSLKGKRVLLLVHGFNATKDDILPGYLTAQRLIAQRVKNGNKPLYDHVVGIVWPGYESKFDYYRAETNAKTLAPRLFADIKKFAMTAAKVDVVGHSMGNRFAFEALKNHRGDNRLIDTFFSLAAAVDDESVDRGEEYASSLKKCRNVEILHSNEDAVLSFLYPLVEEDEALGHEGPENLRKTPRNLQSVDCSSVVDGHSAYFTVTQIYDFIRDRLIGKIPGAPQAKNVQILANGQVQVIPMPKPTYFQVVSKVARHFYNFVARSCAYITGFDH